MKGARMDIYRKTDMDSWIATTPALTITEKQEGEVDQTWCNEVHESIWKESRNHLDYSYREIFTGISAELRQWVYFPAQMTGPLSATYRKKTKIRLQRTVTGAMMETLYICVCAFVNGRMNL